MDNIPTATDVTRTVSLDNYSKRIKNIFTRVLKAHAVTSYKLKNRTNGTQIDNVARKPLKEINLDYAHSTGHGVGYFKCPRRTTWDIKNNKISFKEGMIVSNEPGYYEDGKFELESKILSELKKIKMITLLKI